MDAVSYSGFRKNLKNYMQQVNEDAEALMVTSQSTQEDIVVMSKRDYDAMQETLRILSNRPLMEKFGEAKNNIITIRPTNIHC